MKKRQIKALKMLANRLPPSFTIEKHGVTMTGEELIKEKLVSKEEQDKIVQTARYGGVTKMVQVDINHLRKLKNAFRENKEQGIVDYVKWLDQHNRDLNKFLEECDQLNRVDKGIMGVMNRGVKGFWKSLIMFLYSFVTIFKQEKVGATS